MDVGKRLLHLRKNVLKLNQENFARTLNISRSMISCLEKEERNITDRTVADICRVFKVNEEWLRYGTGDMFAEQSDDLDFMIAKYGYNLSDTQKQIILAMLKMNEVQRIALDGFIDNLLSLRNKTE